MLDGLIDGLGSPPLRTKQFLPGLKWRVSRDTSDNFLIQYSTNGGAWTTKFTFASTGSLIIPENGDINVLMSDQMFGIRFRNGTLGFGNSGAGGEMLRIRSSSDIIRMASTGTMGWSSGLPDAASSDAGLMRTAANVLNFNDGAGTARAGWFQWQGQSRVTTQFDVAASTTLGNITGLTSPVKAGRTYNFRAVLHIAADAVGGIKFAMAGTATATAIIYQINVIANTSNANVITSRQTALGGSAGAAADTAYFAEIEGTITVNAAGTLTAQFAQNAASGTSSVLVGSSLTVFDVQ